MSVKSTEYEIREKKGKKSAHLDSGKRNRSNDLNESREDDLSDVGEDIANVAHAVDLLLTDS